MAVVDGTNAGFVSSEPSSDPAGSVGQINSYSYGQPYTSPAGSQSITKMGYWHDGAGNNTHSWDIGIYSHDAGNNRPNVLLAVSRDNAETSGSNFFGTASVAYDMTASTTYWLCHQVDLGTGTINNNYSSDTKTFHYLASQTALPSTWSADSSIQRLESVWALYSETPSSDLTKSIYDSVTTAETVSRLLDILLLSLSDLINITDAASGSGLVVDLLQSIYDQINISENVSEILPILLKTLSDNVSIVDNASPLLTSLLKSLSENIAVSDSVTPRILVLLQLIADTITISDSLTAAFVGDLLQSLSDSIAISESVSPLIPTLLQLVSDNLTVGESVSPLLPIILKAISDNLSISDSCSPLIAQLVRSLADNISISESVSPLVAQLIASLADTVNIASVDSEYLNILLQNLVDVFNVTTQAQASSSSSAETYMDFDSANGALRIYIRGVLVARFNSDGTLETGGNITQNAF